MTDSHNSSDVTHRDPGAWSIVSRLSHTFRTPLNHVLGFAEILESGSFGPLNERQTKYVARIQAAGRRQLRLLDQLVDIARVNTAELVRDTTEYDVRSMIENLVRQHESTAGGRDVTIATGFDATTRISGDFHQTLQVLGSLLEFAVKRSSAKSTVHVNTIATDDPMTDSKSLEISIIYDGPALSQMEQDLFKHGAPAAGTDQLHDVEGLGLLHANTLTRHLGGELSIDMCDTNIAMIFTVPILDNARLSHALD